MAEEKKTLEDLGAAVAAKAAEENITENANADERPITSESPVPVLSDASDVIAVEPQIDDLGRSYATGKRKGAVARV